MRIPALFCSALLLLVACNRKAAPVSGISPCLQKSIAAWQGQGHCEDPFVQEFVFQGKKVFVLRHGTCGADMTDDVLDEKCNLLGRLGGFAGNMKINGEPFANAQGGKVIWKAQP